MGKHIFLSDVDGTLLRGDSGIPEKVVNAAREYMSAGGLLSLCTGRSSISAGWVARELRINMPCILYTGAAIYDFETKQYIWSNHFDSDILLTLERLYNEYPDFSIQVYSHDKIYILRMNKRLKERGIKEEASGPISRLSDVQGEILKLVLTCDDIERLCQCKDRLFTSHKYNFAFASTHFVEVVPQGAGKDIAMKRMSEYYNVPLSNFFVAGDGMTDLPMIELGGYSFAPSTAPEPLLNTCDMVIPPCEEGGMEIAFNAARKLICGNI